MALACVAVIMAADFLGAHQYWIGITLLLVPVMASFELSPRRTAAFGALAVVLLIWRYGLPRSQWNHIDAWISIITVALGAAACVLACYRRERRLGQLMKSRYTVEMLQHALLHKLPVITDEALVAGFYRAAEDEANVGGDLYEVVGSPYGTRVLVADVQGKGLGALQLAAAVVTAFREAAYYLGEPLMVVERMEQAVTRHRQRVQANGGTADERFVTALVVELRRDGEIRLIDCGHPEPIAFSPTGVRTVPVAEPGLPLGLGELRDDCRRVHTLRLDPEEGLLLYTDGVNESRDVRGAFYPLVRRLRQWTDLPRHALVRTLRADLDVFARGTGRDDQAALFIWQRVEPDSPAATA
ncbi:serine/threonine-protein phosphatase [Streptomyces sp. A7024]|uniref:Serine/threonine-protein phosphatase n=1 Tax=Streptomyces coryli TaxID=1128680 RepID=A0A6G4U7H2_9ACTN|nr:PP2C family protein-serine/threonine phosphatase [Streptomyces coryli]NGN67680.1 serine/threonine-protein phosphatase [Streptomyces coryli]